MASAALTLDSLPRNPRESVRQVLNAAHVQLTRAAALHENVEGALRAGALFNRVVLMPPARTLVCAADKVGSTTINRIASLVLGKPLGKNNGVFIGVPAAFNVSFAKFKRLLKDDSWHRVLLYRDPIERFVSAYQSKCLLRDRDGRKRCHNVFQLEEPTIEAVVARLPRYGYTNAHWAPLSHFCGGTVGAAWSAYSHHIPLHNLSAAFPELLRGRVSDRTMHAIVHYLAKGRFAGNHVTHADQRAALAPAIRQQLVDFYWEDYRLLLSNNVLGLPASKPSI